MVWVLDSEKEVEQNLIIQRKIKKIDSCIHGYKMLNYLCPYFVKWQPCLAVGWFPGFLPYREPCLLTSVMPLHKNHPWLQMKRLLRNQQVNCTKNNKQKAQEGDKTQKRIMMKLCNDHTGKKQKHFK